MESSLVFYPVNIIDIDDIAINKANNVTDNIMH